MGQSTLSASLFLTENVNWRDNRPLRKRERNSYLKAGKFVIKTNLCEWEKFSSSVAISIAIFDTSNWNVRIKQLRPNETEMLLEKPIKFNVHIWHATMEKCRWEKTNFRIKSFPLRKVLWRSLCIPCWNQVPVRLCKCFSEPIWKCLLREPGFEAMEIRIHAISCEPPN